LFRFNTQERSKITAFFEGCLEITIFITKILENEKNSVDVNEMEEKINKEFRNEYKGLFIEKGDLKINYKKNNNKKPKTKLINKNKKYVSRSKY
jgi:hypothetical protein